MKKINLIILLLSVLNSKAQTPIINNLDWNGVSIPNSYVKDINNDMNQFVGTYVYQNNGVYFKIILKKVTMVPYITFFADLIVGEFEYLDINNTVSTLSEIDIIYDDEYLHNIAGLSLIENNQDFPCNDCLLNEKRMNLFFSDTQVGSDLIIRRTIIGGNEVLKAFRRTINVGHRVGDNYISNIVPDGEYILIKQP